MQKITILCVGKLKEAFYKEAAAEYKKRLSRYCQAEILELPEKPLPDAPSLSQIRQALAAEAELIRSKLPSNAYLIALCIEGQQMSSEELAQKMEKLALEGKSHLVFLIGGSFGLDNGLKQQADLHLSLSPMTFPHHLARVILLEQLYRGFQIQEGGSYHK